MRRPRLVVPLEDRGVRELRDKVVFVAGGGSGIGFGIAQAFKEAGARLAIADIDAEAASQAAAQISDKAGTATSHWLDVADPAAWVEAMDAAESTLGPIDVFCNTAGLVGEPRPLVHIPLDRIRRIFEVTVFGVIHGARCVVPRMRGRGGHIIHVSSMAGVIPVPARADYSAAKFAVVAISECLAAELEPDGIGVSVVCPGRVNTRIAETSAKQLENETPTVSPPITSVQMEPIEVGRIVRDAVVEGRLHIFSHPASRKRLEAQFAKVLRNFAPPPDRWLRRGVLAGQVRTPRGGGE